MRASTSLRWSASAPPSSPGARPPSGPPASARTVMGAARRAGGVVAGLLVAGFVVWGVAGGWSKAADYHWSLNWALLALAAAVLAGFYLAWAAAYLTLLGTLSGR